MSAEKKNADPVERYLDEVGDALAVRGVDDRVEIVADLREHIGSAVAAGASVDEVLRGMGDPQLIAAEAGGVDAPGPAVPPAPAGRLVQTWVPVVAVGLVLVGGIGLGLVVPVLLLLGGLVLVWGSSLWSTGEKVVATLVVPAPGLALLVVAGHAVVSLEQSCTSTQVGRDVQEVCTSSGGGSGVGGIVLTVVLGAVVLAGLVAAVVLVRRGLRRARGRAGNTPATHVVD